MLPGAIEMNEGRIEGIEYEFCEFVSKENKIKID